MVEETQNCCTSFWERYGYGALQLFFILQLAVTFFFSITIAIHSNDDQTTSLTEIEGAPGNQTIIYPVYSPKVKTFFVNAAIILSLLLVLTVLLVIYIILRKGHTMNRVGNFTVLKPSESYYVALVTWIINIGVVIARCIGLYLCKIDSGPAWWQLTLCYYLGFLVEQSVQIYCIDELEKKNRDVVEGPQWSTTRKGMYLLLAFFNGFEWLINLINLPSVTGVERSCMEGWVTAPLFRILYTLTRASMLAYRLECIHLFLKFFKEDQETITERQPAANEPGSLGYKETRNGCWCGGFLALFYTGLSLVSYILYNREEGDKLVIATVMVGLSMLNLAVPCSLLLRSGKDTLENEDDDGKSTMQNFEAYVSFRSLSHVRLLLFYSLTAVTYHFVYALHVTTLHTYDVLRIVREVLKGISCIFIALFGLWITHDKRQLRSWLRLNVFWWMMVALMVQDFLEEFASYDQEHDILVLYIFPLAIDFKVFVLIYGYNKISAAKTEYLLEHQREYDRAHPAQGFIGDETEEVPLFPRGRKHFSPSTYSFLGTSPVSDNPIA